jgi:Lamin Tail Domain
VPMTPATLTAQTTAGACSGNIQVSSNDFSQCIAFTAATATLSGGNTTAMLTPAVRLFAGTTYRIRVTTGATSAISVPLTATYTHATGFSTLAGVSACDGNLVISQIFGGGGTSGAPYRNDFVELHNRGTTPMSLSGLSLQYTSSAGTAWSTNKLNLNSATVAAGGFYLVQLGNGGGAVGAALPTPDQTWTLDISTTAGKMALVNGTTGMGATACPDASRVLDFIGYGAAANCFEGTAAAPAPSSTLAALRGEVGCADTNANNVNFTSTAPAPRNSGASASACMCNAAINEVGTAAEADFCLLQSPTSFSTPPATTVYGRIYEAGSTPTAAAAAPNVIAQFGYGPSGSNPTTSSAWLWYSASFNAGFVDASNDEYQYTFAGAVTPGMYSYTYRFSFDGLQWTYCDIDGAGSNMGSDFSSTLLGSMTAN